MSKRLQMNPDVFLMAHHGSVVAWNVQRHEQIELDQPYLQALMAPREAEPPIVAELREADLVREEEPSAWGWDALARYFHLGTMFDPPEDVVASSARAASDYADYCQSISASAPLEQFSLRRGDGDLALPALPDSEHRALRALLAARRSSRSFDGGPISGAALGFVLDETFGYRDHDHAAFASAGLSCLGVRRASPSGGSLQSCEAYLLVRSVDGLEPGVFHYRSAARTLGYVAPLPEGFRFGHAFGGQMFADALSAALVVTSRFDALWWKYPHSRCYRVALLDAGHLAQTAVLTATAAGLSTWTTGLFFDEALRGVLGLAKEGHEYPLLVVGLGSGTPSPVDPGLTSRSSRE